MLVLFVLDFLVGACMRVCMKYACRIWGTIDLLLGIGRDSWSQRPHHCHLLWNSRPLLGFIARAKRKRQQVQGRGTPCCTAVSWPWDQDRNMPDPRGLFAACITHLTTSSFERCLFQHTNSNCTSKFASTYSYRFTSCSFQPSASPFQLTMCTTACSQVGWRILVHGRNRRFGGI